MDNGWPGNRIVFYIAIIELRNTINANIDPDLAPPQYGIGDSCIAIINIHYGSMIGRIASDGTVCDLGLHRRINDTNPSAPNGGIASDNTVCDSAPKPAKYAATG
jgi:hypothetical protein